MDYLKRQKLDARYEISDHCVKITTDSTVYIAAQRADKIDKREFEALYREVRRLARDSGTKIGRQKNGTRAALDAFADYETAHQKFERVFERLVAKARLVQARGLHMGTSDDDVLTEAGAAANAYTQRFWRDNICNRVEESYYNLKNVKDRMLNGRKYEKIWL